MLYCCSRNEYLINRPIIVDIIHQAKEGRFPIQIVYTRLLVQSSRLGSTEWENLLSLSHLYLMMDAAPVYESLCLRIYLKYLFLNDRNFQSGNKLLPESGWELSRETSSLKSKIHAALYVLHWNSLLQILSSGSEWRYL
jgi:hypothetical protein